MLTVYLLQQSPQAQQHLLSALQSSAAFVAAEFAVAKPVAASAASARRARAIREFFMI